MTTEDKELKALEALQEAFQEAGKVGVVWSRDKEVQPWETLVTDQFYDTLIQFMEGTGSRILLMERHEDEDEVNDVQLEELREFFPELDIRVKLKESYPCEAFIPTHLSRCSTCHWFPGGLPNGMVHCMCGHFTEEQWKEKNGEKEDQGPKEGTGSPHVEGLGRGRP